MNPSLSLTEVQFHRAVTLLSAQDGALEQIVMDLGPPPFVQRPPGFAALARIILEQQVSLASAWATFARLEDACTRVEPERVAALDTDQMRSLGISRQKSRYLHLLAAAVLDGALDLEALSDVGDEEARTLLLSVTGIGPWTAEIYLLTVLLRADAWPVGDLGVIVGMQQAKSLPERPGPELLDQIAAAWRPWRGVATRILWHRYLDGVWPHEN